MTLEDIHYDLMYFGEDSHFLELIVRTIARLPPDVITYTLENCVFLSVGRATFGMVLPGRIGLHPIKRRSKGQWLILLAERLPARDAETVIAHEIAHAWLKHDRLGPPPEDCEIQAANQTRDWGFTGIGADADYCHAPFRHLDKKKGTRR